MKTFLSTTALCLLTCAAVAQSSIEINTDKKGAAIPQSLYGVFFEEITGSGDGGLYAEMLPNRGFEEGVLPRGTTLRDGYACAAELPCYSNDSINRFRIRWSDDLWMKGWRTVYADGSAATSRIVAENPLNDATPHSLHLELDKARAEVLVVNTGYRGVAVQQGEKYDLTFYLRADRTPRCRVVIGASGRTAATHDLQLTADGKWHRYDVELTGEMTGNDFEFTLAFPAKGSVWVDHVSLFPRKTFRDRPNGLRRDVAQMIADLKPDFIRWPGGCIVEGLTLENRVRWKETIGDPVLRPGEYNLWGYRSSYGLGYHEFLQYCEDIDADGMFVCNAGMSCLFRNGDFVQGEALEPLIQEALDAIDYALGDGTTEWSRKRVENGHPAPFPLKYIEIGNENVFARYAENYNRFHKAIKAKYPQLTILTALMFSKDVERLDKVEVIDPHYYETPDWFYDNADVYDKLPKRLPYKIYVGEYAAVGRPSLYASLAEAAYLMGIERNADKVQLTSYAPLLENASYGQNHLIVLKNDAVYGRSNYHIVKLLSENRPDYNVSAQIREKDLAVPFAPEGFIGLGTESSAAQFKDLRIEQHGKTLYATDWSDFSQAWEPLHGQWKAENGMLTQAAASGAAMIRLKGIEVGDCTITLKAKKTAGHQGFRVIFGGRDANHYFMADMGSHSNESVLFREVGDRGWVSLFDYRNQEPVEVNQWYDIRIVIRGNHWECYMDGKLKYAYDYRIVNKHYAVAGYDQTRKELVVKLVNGRSEPWKTTLRLTGRGTLGKTGERIVLGAKSADEENSFESPEKIAAQSSEWQVAGREIPISCDANSLTILRIPYKKQS